MVCFCCCCDPHLLAYISGIITAIEAAVFSVLNIVLICMSQCYIKPPDTGMSNQISDFWNWYFYDSDAESCSNMTIGSVDTYPLTPDKRLSQTTAEENFKYQITYLVLHVLWFVSCFIMIYGNARKRWGYYLPWLLIALTLLIMDVVIASFFIEEITLLDLNPELVFDVWPMLLAVSLYFRGFVFWLTNLVEFGTVMNAFCKSYHKRSKQESNQKKLEKKQRANQLHQDASQAGRQAEAVMGPGGVAVVASSGGGNYPRGPGVTQYHANAPPHAVGDSYVNPAFDPDHPPVYPNQPAPMPRELPKVPTELRPFSYLNPGFRPTHPHDVDGMKAGGLAQLERGYLSDDGEHLRHPQMSPSHHHDAPPTDTFPKRHDSLRSLPVQQDTRPLRRYASSRDHARPGFGNGPAYDPRPPTILPRVNLKAGPPPTTVMRGPETHPPRDYGPPRAYGPPPSREDVVYF
ncbi:uncharacterized protein LOC122259225 isoform X2 [Penaeus japonicus]|uniref:uncharacterized protein LOC122259225 isoform X2 n=1 Tax=Penaeus japonicus TaxID=27405 RepID=UPI001C70E7D8|nr:uncharacterized protein LOC122259225 isoform X2 [Penaeus japonicus]